MTDFRNCRLKGEISSEHETRGHLLRSQSRPFKCGLLCPSVVHVIIACLCFIPSHSGGTDTCGMNNSGRGRALQRRNGIHSSPPLRFESVTQSHISQKIKLRGPSSCGRQGWQQWLGEAVACVLKSFVFPHHLCKELDMTA